MCGASASVATSSCAFQMYKQSVAISHLLIRHLAMLTTKMVATIAHSR